MNDKIRFLMEIFRKPNDFNKKFFHVFCFKNNGGELSVTSHSFFPDEIFFLESDYDVQDQ